MCSWGLFFSYMAPKSRHAQIGALAGCACSNCQSLLGEYGSLLLALIVIVACLAAIGLITAFSKRLLNSFKTQLRVLHRRCQRLALIFANVGLTNIIFSTPVLMFVYPLAWLWFTDTGESSFGHRRRVHQATYFRCRRPLWCLERGAGVIHDASISQSLLKFATHYLPLFSYGFGWVVPAVGFVIKLLLSLKNGETVVQITE